MHVRSPIAIDAPNRRDMIVECGAAVDERCKNVLREGAGVQIDRLFRENEPLHHFLVPHHEPRDAHPRRDNL